MVFICTIHTWGINCVRAKLPFRYLSLISNYARDAKFKIRAFGASFSMEK